MAGYTVVDVETTGLVPERTDRIVEIGVTYVSHEGQVQDHWSTLVNPHRDLGPTKVHGIQAADVVDAPTFQDVAPYVLRALQGRILVAHNASFDVRFLRAELVRAGVPLKQPDIPAVCTMRWASAFLRGAGRRLHDCCQTEGITLTNAHSAAGDAMATASLLARYLERSRYQPPWIDSLAASRAYPWPQYSGRFPEFRPHPRGAVSAAAPGTWLDRIVSRMPRHSSPRVEEYLAVLEMAMLDGILAEHEKDSLVLTAQNLGLTRGQVLDIHGSYLTAMAAVAWDDGVVTASEREELTHVAGLLGLTPHDVDTALDDAAEHRSSQPTHDSATSGMLLSQGDRVVFTGDMQRDRSEWEAMARAAGLQPGGVTKSTAIVVAADPNSLSGKAAKARSYGIPIVTESAFEKLLQDFVRARGNDGA